MLRRLGCFILLILRALLLAAATPKGGVVALPLVESVHSLDVLF